MGKLQTSLISASIGAVVGAILFAILNNNSSNKIFWIICGFVLFGTISGIVAGTISKEDYDQYISEEDEEKTCRSNGCDL